MGRKILTDGKKKTITGNWKTTEYNNLHYKI